MKDLSWIVYAASLATTAGVIYLFCAIFDALFPPPFGLIRWLQPASPLPIGGSRTGFITGLAMFIVVGFLLGAVFAIARSFWSERLKLADKLQVITEGEKLWIGLRQTGFGY